MEPLGRINADPRFTRWLTPDGSPFTREQTVQALARWIAHWDEHGFGLWVVEERGSGRVVGRTGAAFHTLWPDDPEVGWGLDPAVWGRGYATEAGATVIRSAFETLALDRLVSIVHPQNEASKRVQERLGIRPWRTVHWPEGGVELEMRTLGRADWARLQSSA